MCQRMFMKWMVNGVPVFRLATITRYYTRFLQIRLRHESRDKYVIHISKTAFQKMLF